MKDYYNSRRYHSYFEGYTETEVEENGKQKIKRVYTGDYYSSKLTDQQWRDRKVIYDVLFGITLLLFLYVCLQPFSINISRCAAICQGLLLLDLLWLLVSLFDFTRSKRKMTMRIYRISSKRITIFTPIAAALFMLLAAVYLVEMIRQSAATAEFLRLFLPSILCSLAMFAIYRLEYDTEYEIVYNDVKPDKDGKKIEY